MLIGIIKTSMFCFGFHLVTRQEKLLDFIANAVRKYLNKLSKPFADCPVCMASIWGTLFFCYFNNIALSEIVNYLIFIFSVACLNGLLEAFYLACLAIYKFKVLLIDESLLESLTTNK